jgi:peptidoglycan/xylan/chitin deacetylase (PgdA/CDA1 family)
MLGYILLLPFWGRRRKNNLLILRYHSISDHRRHEVNVRPSDFARQMELLARNCSPLSLKQAVSYLQNNTELPKKSSVLTFDDGYKDNFTNAYPILKKFNLTATIFLVSGYIGTDRILPHDTGDIPAYNYLLGWEEAREMATAGIDFGSHTCSHANLAEAGKDLQKEIINSKKTIEDNLKEKVMFISYPFGLCRDFNQEVKRIAIEAGYICGCSAMNGINDTNTDIFELRRIGIEASDNMFTFRAKLNGALGLLVFKDNLIFNKFLNLVNRLIGV